MTGCGRQPPDVISSNWPNGELRAVAAPVAASMQVLCVDINWEAAAHRG